jgi:hypothetical protein
MLKLERIGTINGSPEYYISCDEKIENRVKIHSRLVEKETEELFCYSTNVEGVYSFGCKQLTNGVFHEAGYIWSSRPGCINGEFGTKLVEATINGVGYWYIDIEVLKPLVEAFTNELYEIEQYHACYDKDKKEPIYRLIMKER